MHGEALREFAAASGDSATHLLTRASTLMMTALLERLSARGHSPVRLAHLAVFAGLDPEGTRISALAARAGISRQAMSVLVHDLEASGYVRSTPDPSDRRATVVELDARGAEFCRAAVVVSAELDAAVAAAVGGDELARIRTALRTVIGPDGPELASGT